MGQTRRIVNTIEVAADDSFFYCGTSTGDILAINVDSERFQQIGPPKSTFSLGVTVLKQISTGEFVVGTGDGSITVCAGMDKKFKPTGKSQRLDGAVTGIALRGQGHQFFVGTKKSHLYRFTYADFKHELINTCHFTSVNDIQFPYGTSELFATCSYEDIRIWHLCSCKELLRITVPNMTCNSIAFSTDGKSIISGWSDGRIRGFTPESGKLIWIINDAHNKGVTAVAVMSDGRHVISGGGEGQVRVWEVSSTYAAKGSTYVSRLLETMKEHKGTITEIKVKKNDLECVSASTDGTCIIWDLERFIRKQIIFANTMFRTVCYHPDEVQIITSGSDRKVGYWEIFDGSCIREIEGARSGSINGLDVDTDGMIFVSGGDDRLLKVWKYNEGEVTHVGLGHSGPISKVRITQDLKWIVSISTDGAVLRWAFPYGPIPKV